MRIRENVNLKRYTTVGIGGQVKYLIEIHDRKELVNAFNFIKNTGLEYFVLGGGSNLLISDEDLNMIAIKPQFSSVQINNTTVYAEASIKLPRLIKFLVDEELSGLEELAEIPGELGGAVFMNAGSYGREIGELIEEIEVFDGTNLKVIPGRDIEFSYRKTNLPEKYIITRVKMKLSKGDKRKITKTIQQVKEKRKKSQPVGEKTFGSVFKNPEDYPAGYLIDRCGLKGYRKNDAKISEKHANFIVNMGKATFSDVTYLMDLAKKRVKERFGIKLEPEVIIIKGGLT